MTTDYERELDAAWQRHLAPRAPDAPTVISTFAGCGGSSLGYSIAGYRELAVVEWNDHACDTLRLNYPHVHVFQGDIKDVQVADVLAVTGLQPGELTVFDGSPPCQGFSTSGNRQVDDPRNQLFREYVRLLSGLAPRGFVMENVSGMVKGKMRLLFREIVEALSQAGPGYTVRAWLLNSADYGVPSARPRVLFIGTRSDLGIEPSVPQPTSRRRTVREALEGLTDPGPYVVPHNKGARLAPFIPPGGSGADAFGAVGLKESFYNLGRAAWDKPAPTIMSTLNDRRAGLLHPEHDRFLGVEELKRVCSYPAAFQFAGTPRQPERGETKTYVHDVWARIGNSVMPLFMAKVAEHLAALLAPTGEAAA